MGNEYSLASFQLGGNNISREISIEFVLCCVVTAGNKALKCTVQVIATESNLNLKSETVLKNPVYRGDYHISQQ